MLYSSRFHKGVKTKELGPAVKLSLTPRDSYNSILKKAIREFFPSVSPQANFYLSDSSGSRLSPLIDGIPWVLGEYLHKHSYYPSKTRFYCVHVSRLDLVCRFAHRQFWDDIILQVPQSAIPYSTLSESDLEASARSDQHTGQTVKDHFMETAHPHSPLQSLHPCLQMLATPPPSPRRYSTCNYCKTFQHVT